MEAPNKIGTKIKGQITRFAGQLSAGFYRPKGKFLSQMLYGIQASEDVKVSNVARSLREGVDLIQTEKRLTRQLSQDDLTGPINQRLIEMGKISVGEKTVLALDLSDLSKRHAKKMEAMAHVHDGSEGGIGQGYFLCAVMGAEVKGEQILPLYSELYSQKAAGFQSENAQILKAVDSVVAGVGSRGIWVIDRGGDRETLIDGLSSRGLHFVIRMVGSRHEAGEQSLLAIAEAMRCPFQREIILEKPEGRREKKILQLGAKEIHLPFVEHPLWLVVMKGWGEKPMMLLTDLKPKRKEEFVHFVLEAYLTRWKCEEGFRFIKQSYQLEDVRVRSYVALRNTVILVHAVFYFVSKILGQRLKLNILLKKICEKAQRFFEIPAFKCYAIADGIYKVLFSMTQGLATLPKPENYPQLSLPLEGTF